MRNLALLASALFACVPFGAGELSAQAAPAVSFVNTDTLKLGAANVRHGAVVLLRNSGAESRKLRLVLTGVEKHLPLPRLVGPDTGTFTLRAGTTARPVDAEVRLLPVAGGEATPHVYHGTVQVVDSAGRVVASRHLALDLTIPAGVAADTGWSSSIYKAAPLPALRAHLGDGQQRCGRDPRMHTGMSDSKVVSVLRHLVGVCVRDNEVPLQGATMASPSRPVPSKEAVPGRAAATHHLMGVLHGPGGRDRALVWWTGERTSAGALELSFTSFDEPGTYRGSIRLAPAGVHGAVNLTVAVTHDWLFPLILLFAGVVLSFFLQQYLRTRRTTLVAESDLAALLDRAGRVDARLKKLDSREPGFLPYQVSEALVSNLREEREGLRRSVRLGRAREAEEAAKRIGTSIEGWKAEVGQWAGLADALQRLSTALSAARHRAASLGAGGARALLLVRSDEHLSGRPLTGEELVARRERIVNDAHLLVRWDDVASAVCADLQKGDPRAAAARERLLTADDEAGIDEARALLRGPAEEKPGYAPDVDEVGHDAGAPGGGGGVAAPALKRLQLPGDVVGEEELRETAGVTGREREREEKRAREGSERGGSRRQEKREVENAWLYLALSTVVVTLTGLTTLYFDQPVFGTPSDYLGAFLWGFGGKLGLDFVRDAVNAGEVPWPKWARRSAAPPAQRPAGETVG